MFSTLIYLKTDSLTDPKGRESDVWKCHSHFPPTPPPLDIHDICVRFCELFIEHYTSAQLVNVSVVVMFNDSTRGIVAGNERSFSDIRTSPLQRLFFDSNQVLRPSS